MDTEASPDWYKSHPVTETLLTAPPGCGKTEGISRWVAEIARRGDLVTPRRVLALTFSNKANANLRSRLRDQLGLQWWKFVTVKNFHGWAYHLYQHHCASVGRTVLDATPQRGWLASLTSSVCSDFSCDKAELAETLRACKIGAYDDDRVLENLENHGLSAAVEYEHRLRKEGQSDFDDLIRLGLLVLGNERVCALYRERFCAVIVDEVQDLSVGHFDLIAPIGPGRTLWAGDSAQGIYEFAGAQPTEVFARILDRNPDILHLSRSFRSSPSVLKAVSAISLALGSREVRSASEDEWTNGRLLTVRHQHVTHEARWSVDTAAKWMEENPSSSVAVIARTGRRRQWIDEEVRSRGVDAEIWDYPAHKPSIVALLRRRIGEVDLSLPPHDAVDDLYRRCLADLDPVDLDLSDELAEVFDTIGTLAVDAPLIEIVSGIRISSTADEPVGPGLHLLNGHVGKGQQFDRVILVGLEESFLPHYFAMKSGRKADMQAELAVLHVMASRAREQLVACTCESVPKWSGEDLRRDQSRWFTLIEAVADETLDLRTVKLSHL